MDDIELARIPAGTVQLVDAARRRYPAEVAAFELGVFAVTEAQAAELVGVPARHPSRPVVDVSWLRAIRLCNAASEWEGLDAAYGVDGEDVVWHEDADGYRLPTEAEWEFACRAGSTGAHYGPLPDIAWTAADGLGAPRDVGLRLPNLHGLFDMLGNAWEWCWDLADDDGSARVQRGGGFANAPSSVTATARRQGAPRRGFDDVGLRFARSL